MGTEETFRHPNQNLFAMQLHRSGFPFQLFGLVMPAFKECVKTPPFAGDRTSHPAWRYQQQSDKFQ